MRSRRDSASIAIEVRRRNLDRQERDAVSRGRWRRSAPRSCSIPATMPACSTRRWPRSTGTSCRTISGAGAPAANASARALAIFVEKSGLGPVDGVRVAVDPAGLVEVVTGAASLGQGVETVMAQICADALGVDYRRVRVVHGQTDRIAFGMGAFASRVTVMTGEATRLAAVKVRAKAIEIAAELLQQPADALDIVDGEVVRKDGRRGPSMTLGEIAKALRAGVEAARRPRARAVGRRLVLQRSHELSLRRPYRGRAGRSRHRRRDDRALPASPTTSAAPSIRCWSRARSSAASRRGSAARCSRSSSTTSAASRCRSPSPTI